MKIDGWKMTIPFKDDPFLGDEFVDFRGNVTLLAFLGPEGLPQGFGPWLFLA